MAIRFAQVALGFCYSDACTESWSSTRSAKRRRIADERSVQYWREISATTLPAPSRRPLAELLTSLSVMPYHARQN